MERLYQIFRLTEDESAYFEKCPHIITPLIEGVEVLKGCFGSGIELRAEVERECCSEQLFVKICTPLGAEEAMKKLNEFDISWWFNQPAAVHEDLEFTLEFI